MRWLTRRVEVAGPDELSVERHQDSLLAWPEVAVSLDGLGDADSCSCDAGRCCDVAEQAAQCAGVEPQDLFEPNRRFLAGSGLPSLPLRDRSRRNLDQAGQVSLRDARLVPSLLEDVAKHGALGLRSHELVIPSSLWAAAAPAYAPLTSGWLCAQIALKIPLDRAPRVFYCAQKNLCDGKEGQG